MRKSTVFWKVAGILVGVQVLIAGVAVVLTFQLSYGHSQRLASNSIRLRVDAAAVELEERAELRAGLTGIRRAVLVDLLSRFEDPVFLLEEEGEVFAIGPDGSLTGLEQTDTRLPPEVRRAARRAVADDSLAIDLSWPLATASWAAAPLFDEDGFRAGGLIVFPLSATLDAELSATRSAYRRSTVFVSLLATLLALILGFFFTRQIVQPLRRISNRVEQIGSGDFAQALPEERMDEFGRLATSVNAMAERIRENLAALKSADETRRRLVANMGHDLRTPLAGLLGYTEQALHLLENGRQEEARHALETASRQGRYLGNLVDDLFELSLLDHVPAPIRSDPVPLGELLNESAGAHRVRFQQADIRFEANVPERLPVIIGDGIRLLRLLDNLFSNALRHTPPGGNVTLSASLLGGAVQIAVEDSGQGIGEGEEALIFERHVRGSDARTRRTEGTGLGLAICRSIARAHGGELSVRRASQGGARFELLLPTSNEKAPAD